MDVRIGNGPLKRKDWSLEMRESKNSFAVSLVVHMVEFMQDNGRTWPEKED